MIIDQQNDKNLLWPEIAEFWPSEMEMPELGIAKNANLTEEGHYPVDTPSDILASAMYFVLENLDKISSDENMSKVAEALDEYLDVYDLEIPEEFIQYAMQKNLDKVASFIEEDEEEYADDDELLPVTTKEQLLESSSLFAQNSNKWSDSDIVKISHNLKAAAEAHGIEINERHMPFSHSDYEVDWEKLASSISARKRAMLDLQNIMSFKQDEDSIQKIASDARTYIEGLDAVFDMEDGLEIVSYLEEIDQNFGVDGYWGKAFSRPSESVFNHTKVASSSKYAGCDFSKLSGIFDDDIIAAIAEDPETIIPTLPTPQLDIFNQVMFGK